MGVTAIAGGVQTDSSASGGKVYALNNISTVAQQVIAANPSRQTLTFHNPGDVDIFVAPTQKYDGSTFTDFTPTTGALGGTFRVYSNGGTLTITGECQQAWQALSASSNDKPLTIMDSNIG